MAEARIAEVTGSAITKNKALAALKARRRMRELSMTARV